jgi:copper chaperone NosL
MIYRLCFILFICAAVLSCNAKVEPIRFGIDACENCKMKIMDPKFGGVILTKKGKTFKFDDIRCLLFYFETNFKNKQDIATIQVIDYSSPQKLITKDSAVFIQSNALRSPMSSGFAAIADTSKNSDLLIQFNATILSWDQLKLYLE